MKSAQGLNGIWLSGVMGGAAILMAAQVVQAAAQVTDVKVSSTASGVDILLQTKGGDRPQVFSVNKGNTWTADIINTQLKLPQGTFRQANPATGIAMITVAPLDGNSVRVTVTGHKSAPVGKISRSEDGKLVFNLAQSVSGSAKASSAANASASTVAQPSRINALRSENPASSPALPLSVAQTGAAPQVTPSVTPGSKPSLPQVKPTAPSQVAQVPSPLPPFQGATPMVPAPQVKYQPNPNTRPIPSPPQAPNPLPRAIAPPVGDIATGQIDASPGYIDLGTAERIPRLVLRDASSREVLSLLARSAGLNIVFTADQAGQQPGGQQPGQQPGQPSAQDGPKVTLDIVNEPVQNVFNYVLQVTGLEASRRGNTIFVGPRLPNSARNLVVRSLRLNQIPVSNALNFLVGLGAESSISRERLVTSVNAVPVTQLQGAAAASAITQTQTTTETRVETQRVNFQDSTPLLRGVQVAGDERTNTITIIGEARKVDVAIGQLTQLDIRRRQVAVNVRVIDINLLALDRLGVSFSFGVNDTQVINQGGIGVVNFGTRTPATTGITADLTNTTIGTPQNFFGFPAGQFPTGGFVNNFFLQLQAAVTNGSAKILTDPTLVVQEGQKAEVRLTQEVVTNIVQNVTGGTGNTPATVTITVQKASAGLILPVQVDRIDDNGFISLSIAPSIARPDSSFQLNLPGTGGSPTSSNLITLLSERRVESGQFRLRDGQTLVLSGIIQDEDRTTVTKVPILGDIPILGALFRRTDRQNQRREVIVLVTPRVLDDSDRSAFGYSYTPGPEVQRVLSK
ncbi:type IV pilus secretin family protein [Leptodesmis sichuanensis]|uniref:type IV pilus secretin family protein n=1 Tax=Leptodesmis sichuanensis TaxID=2906798 RepID=UPI001F343B3E|nr:type IV pilus secretin family protein [Leptodesmis sichuanensis]UIE37948.1 AMIN domain-containing protein [Leptodesmis sichuanensis A121]